MTAINTSKPIEHIDDLRLIMKAHRYGVGETINSKVKAFRSGGSRNEFKVGADRVAYHGNAWSLQLALDEQLQRIGQEIDQTERAQLSRNATHAQNAAEQGKVKPGCSGGSGFLSQTESEAKESIFGGKENEPKRWMSCPFCKKKEAVKARVCDTNLKCRHCTAEVRGGKVVNTGNGGKAEVQPQPQETDSNIVDIEKKRHEKIAAETQQGVTGEQSTKAVS